MMLTAQGGKPKEEQNDERLMKLWQKENMVSSPLLSNKRLFIRKILIHYMFP